LYYLEKLVAFLESLYETYALLALATSVHNLDMLISLKCYTLLSQSITQSLFHPKSPKV